MKNNGGQNSTAITNWVAKSTKLPTLFPMKEMTLVIQIKDDSYVKVELDLRPRSWFQKLQCFFSARPLVTFAVDGKRGEELIGHGELPFVFIDIYELNVGAHIISAHWKNEKSWGAHFFQAQELE